MINATSAAEPVGAYPHARREGDFIFLSGVGPREPGTKKIPGVELDGQGNIVSYDVAVQTHSVIRNVKAVLEAAGSSLDDIIDVQAYLTNMKQDFPTYNKIYAEYFAKIQATRTTIEVGSLPTPIAVEFKVVARVRNG
ncbi:MAG: RidA family protein [Bacteriovoracia bacterium]